MMSREEKKLKSKSYEDIQRVKKGILHIASGIGTPLEDNEVERSLETALPKAILRLRTGVPHSYDKREDVLYYTFRNAVRELSGVTYDDDENLAELNECYSAMRDLSDTLEDYENHFLKEWESYYGKDPCYLYRDVADKSIPSRITDSLLEISQGKMWYELEDNEVGFELMTGGLSDAFLKHDITLDDKPTPVELYNVMVTVYQNTTRKLYKEGIVPNEMNEEIIQEISRLKSSFPSNRACYDAIVQGYEKVAESPGILTYSRVDEGVRIRRKNMMKSTSSPVATNEEKEADGALEL